MLACFFVFGLTGKSGGRSLTSGVAGSQAPVSHQTLPSLPSVLSGYMGDHTLYTWASCSSFPVCLALLWLTMSNWTLACVA